MDSRDVVQPRDFAPVSKPAYDPIGRFRTHVDSAVGCDKPHARVEVALSQLGESFDEAFRLPGNEFERAVAISTVNSSHPAATEGAVTIEHDGRFVR